MDAILAPVLLEDDGRLASADEAALFAALGATESARAPQVIRRGLNYSHEAMIDAIVANPGISQNELAALFGYTASWISQIVNSDIFQAKLASRSAEFRDPILLASMEEQFKGILARGLELTRKKLEAENVSDNFLLRSVEMTSRALGYGAKRDGGGDRKDNAVEKLTDLSANLVGLLHQQRRAAVTFDEGETI